jgi:peptidoglycan/LPS O-acetylase OafA/YrhL
MSQFVNKNRYFLLDGARGIAAFSVVFFHFYLWQIKLFSGIPIAVDFFFVLSGFVLGPGLLGPRRYTRKKFILIRIFRLYPAIFVSFSIIALTQFIPAFRATSTAPSLSFVSYFLAILLLQIFVASIFVINGPLWSLSAEFFVNVISVFFGSQRRNILLLIMIGFLLELLSVINVSRNNLISVLFPEFNYWWVGRALVGFNFGLLLYIRNSTRNQKINLLTSPKSKLIIILILLTVIFLLASYSSIFIIFAAPAFYFIISQIILIDQRYIPLRYSRSCFWLGEISYGIYVFHVPVHQILTLKFLETYLNFDMESRLFLILGLLINLLCILLMAMFSLRFIERPFRHWATKRFVE